MDPNLAALPRAIADYTGTGVAFSASELLLEADDRLRAALGDLGAPALGRLLARLEWRNVDGLCVTRVGRDAGGVIWSIRAAS